jgi:hypothetical protein
MATFGADAVESLRENGPNAIDLAGLWVMESHYPGFEGEEKVENFLEHVANVEAAVQALLKTKTKSTIKNQMLAILRFKLQPTNKRYKRDYEKLLLHMHENEF